MCSDLVTCSSCDYDVFVITQINFGRQCANIASLLVDMSNCLMAELFYCSDGEKYTEELGTIDSTLRKVQSPLCKLETQ